MTPGESTTLGVGETAGAVSAVSGGKDRDMGVVGSVAFNVGGVGGATEEEGADCLLFLFPKILSTKSGKIVD